jgi:hypothetical protein
MDIKAGLRGVLIAQERKERLQFQILGQVRSEQLAAYNLERPSRGRATPGLLIDPHRSRRPRRPHRILLHIRVVDSALPWIGNILSHNRALFT